MWPVGVLGECRVGRRAKKQALGDSSMASQVCSLVSPFITLFQNVLNTLFGAFSFLGISAPNIGSSVYQILSGFGITCAA